jgi:adenylate kinase
MRRGDLVPDPVILQIVGERLEQPDCRAGCLLDGFPRTLKQAEVLDDFLAELGTHLNHVIEIRVDEEEIIRRLLTRQRGDDQLDVIQSRIQAYWRKTWPLLDYYRKREILRQINGNGSEDEVFGRIRAVVGA